MNIKKHKKNWIFKDGAYICKLGQFASSPRNRPEFSAKLYIESKQLDDLINTFVYSDPDITVHTIRSLEVGCGYGRLSGFLSDFSYKHYAIDPNEEMINIAKNLYPHIIFRKERVQNLSFSNYMFDFVITWTVLQHISPSLIKKAVNEIRRVIKPNGILFICENMRNDLQLNDHNWSRTEKTYAKIFEMKKIHSEKKKWERDCFHPNDNILILKNKVY